MFRLALALPPTESDNVCHSKQFTQQMLKLYTVIPLHWQIFIGHSPKKYRTSDENIGFIGHVSVYQYTSAMRGI